jgi:cytosine/uracil/thiamine/allantoin permease
VRFIDPMFKGMAGTACGLFLLVSVGSALFKELEPSPELLRTIAGIGASFFLAYVIEAAWLIKRFPAGKRSEIILGVLVGFAASGLLGVIFALMLSELPVGESFGRSEDFRFWWSILSLGGLGFLVALQPAIVHDQLVGTESTTPERSGSDSGASPGHRPDDRG